MKDIICIDSKIFDNLLKKSLQNCQKTSNNIFLRDPPTSLDIYTTNYLSKLKFKKK